MANRRVITLEQHRGKIIPIVGIIVLSVVSRLGYKEYTTNKYSGSESLEGKTVIITGANTGIGKATALEFAKRGGKVYMACRDMGRCEKAREEIVLATKNPEVHCRLCDLACLQSVRNFAYKFCREEPALHILVNNAGVMRCPKMLTEDGFEMQFGVNHIGHFTLTNLLLDKMRNSGPSRIITLTSETHKSGAMNFDDLNSAEKYDEIKAYDQSKLANVLFSRELAKKIGDWCISSYCVSPGVVYTEIGRHLGMFKWTIVNHFLHPFLTVLLKTPKQGAQTSIYCALAPELEKESGKYYSNCQEAEPAPQALDDEAARKLWMISEKWTTPRVR